MNTFIALANLSLATLVTVAAVSDVRTRRIPNWLVALGLVIALVAQLVLHGSTNGALQWLGGAATGMGLCLGIYVLGGMGAGDVKLMGTVGAFMGPLGGAHVVLISFLAGGVLALAAMLAHRQSRQVLSGVSALLLALPFGQKTTAAATTTAAGLTGKSRAMKLPYAVAIAAGTFLVKWELL